MARYIVIKSQITSPETMSELYCRTKKWSIHKDHGVIMGDETNYVNRARKLLSEVRRDNYKVAHQGLQMIDAIQRLGIDHCFEKEIREILDDTSSTDDRYWHAEDLYETSLRFRLLRQHGHHVHAGVFGKLKDKEGKFSTKDIKGLMGLYEASQVATHGEEDNMLVEAGHLSYQILQSWLHDHNHDEDDQEKRAVEHTLNLPYHKSLARFSAKEFLQDFQGTSEWVSVLKHVAILDRCVVKSIHQKEIHQLSEWWEGLGLGKELKYARSEPVKWHMWSMAVLTDPSLSKQRLDLTKPISLVYIIDDIFDVYGSLDQLTLFTHVVNRWEYEAIEELPEFMQICAKALFDTTQEISDKIYNEHGFNPIQSLQKAWKKLCNAFLVEAKWFARGETPRANEYLKNAIVTSGVHVPLLHIFFLLGHKITTQTIQQADSFPDIISCSATILRLWDDLGSAKDENQEGRDGCYIEYYMKENNGICRESAKERVMEMIWDSWRRLNGACLSDSNPFSQTFTEACLNTARMVPLMYGYDEKQNLPSLKEYIKSLLAP